MFATPRTTKPLRKVFLSSPFSEPRGHSWMVRQQLYDCLRSSGFRPWTWEKDGQKAKARLGWSDAEILVQAIRQCDVVVSFFKNRAGSYLPPEAFDRMPTEPFHATVFEIAHARSLGKPVHLYVVGHNYKASLASILSVLADPLLLPDHAKVLGDESQLEDAVLAKLKESLTTSYTDPTVPSAELELGSLEANLDSMCSADTLWDAECHAERVPLVMVSRLSRRTKRLYADVLAKCANVLANRAIYDRAIVAGKLSVRCLLELRSWSEMYAQIGALSGILNMAGQPNAKSVNFFGLIPAIRTYDYLLPVYFDSAGSILMRSGRWRSARKWLRRVAETEPKPYSQSKFAMAIAASGDRGDIDEAARILYSAALPEARHSNESLPYTLRHAAALAIAQDEFGMAGAFLSEAHTECLKVGALHTLQRVRKLESLLNLVSPQ